MNLDELSARLERLEELWEAIEVARFVGSIESYELTQAISVDHVYDGGLSDG